MRKLNNLSVGRLCRNYRDFSDFHDACATYNLHSRLGYHTPQEAWQENPTITWGVNPGDFRRFRKYQWISYGVIGNERDGYEVNDAHYTSDFYELPYEPNSSKEIYECLHKQGFFKVRVLQRLMEIDFEDPKRIEFKYKGKPQGELRLVS